MVGHTGKYEEAIKGVEATDQAIGIIYAACQEHGYTLFVTADHGNAEKMISDDGGPHTAHTTARGRHTLGSLMGLASERDCVCGCTVPFAMASKTRRFVTEPPTTFKALCDVAPTILDYMGLGKPESMTGRSLLEKV